MILKLWCKGTNKRECYNGINAEPLTIYEHLNIYSNMNLQETIIQLNELKLRGMSSSFEAMTSLPVQNRPSLEVAISKMVDAEVQDRRD